MACQTAGAQPDLSQRCAQPGNPCPKGSELDDIFTGNDPAKLAYSGATICINYTTDMVKRTTVIRDITDQAEAVIPQASGGVNPTDYTLLHIPTIFYLTKQQPVSATVNVDGVAVTITATPHITWNFGDGTPTRNTTAGQPYNGTDPRIDPTGYVLHTYAHPGDYTATATITWTPTYTIPYDIRGSFTRTPITRTLTIDIPVKAAHAVLVY